jgi:glycosyltransferase involved in cell wall biosynthesis
MRIVLVEPFFSGSHRLWAEGLKANSTHEILILSLPGRHWKWRMHGAAITLSTELAQLPWTPDLIVATDMLDVATFKALLPQEFQQVNIALYFHENQLAYPWSPAATAEEISRDKQYGFINYTSALAADAVLFSSAYNQSSFCHTLPSFLSGFPDHQNAQTVDRIVRKSTVLPVGLDLKRLELPHSERSTKPTVLWNHRWEHDKNPEDFFTALYALSEENLDFDLIVLGKSYSSQPAVFEAARKRLSPHIVHWGYAESLDEYRQLLHRSTVAPVTSNQDFFGISALEAVYCGAQPLWPNRLAFPEHFNETAHLYDSSEQFYLKLKSILDSAEPEVNLLYKKQLEVYEWRNCIHNYDAQLKIISALRE